MLKWKLREVEWWIIVLARLGPEIWQGLILESFGKTVERNEATNLDQQQSECTFQRRYEDSL